MLITVTVGRRERRKQRGKFLKGQGAAEFSNPRPGFLRTIPAPEKETRLQTGGAPGWEVVWEGF